MVGSRACSAPTKTGERCGATPLHDADVCFWHSPEHAEDAAAARKLGGQRRRRESTLAGAYEIGPLDTLVGIRRVLEIVTFDGLGMETNSIARGRLLIAAAQALTKLLEVGELEARLEAVEAALKPRIVKGKR
ncbi:MAG: hypothetical protein HY874_09600 [Chloroflexi bacterium]|nr:hypothetical protein [Chloroflexota bacterium]